MTGKEVIKALNSRKEVIFIPVGGEKEPVIFWKTSPVILRMFSVHTGTVTRDFSIKYLEKFLTESYSIIITERKHNEM